MSSLNQVSLIGNVGKDPEVRYLQSGDAVANFSLATSEKWNDKSGQKQGRTEWHRVEVFGKAAEIVQSYVSKGSKLFVQGSLAYDEWTDKDGNKRNTTKIKVGFGGKVVLLGGNDRAAANARSQRSEPVVQAAADGDDIPF